MAEPAKEMTWIFLSAIADYRSIFYRGSRSPALLSRCLKPPEEIRSWDELGEEIIGLVETLTDQYNVDPEKVALTGHSMGGIGTWMIAYEYPAVFCRIAR